MRNGMEFITLLRFPKALRTVIVEADAGTSCETAWWKAEGWGSITQIPVLSSGTFPEPISRGLSPRANASRGMTDILGNGCNSEAWLAFNGFTPLTQPRFAYGLHL